MPTTALRSFFNVTLKPILQCRICEEACLKPATGSTMIMDNERPVWISNFEICEITAVSG